jgi:hypothetical protein
MGNFSAAVGPTGGLAYHFTAWRFRSTWKPFRERIHAWLNAWNPTEKNLLLIGPSAGYTLPSAFLERFNTIRVIEPDPLARIFLKKRFPESASRITFLSAESILPWWNADEEDPGLRFKTFLRETEDAQGPLAVLFCNFLGQLPLLKLNYEEKSLRNAFDAALAPYTWASYHDLFSGRAKDFDRCPDTLVLTGPTETLARRFFRNEAEVIDHGTTWLGEGSPVAVCRWLLSPKHGHVIAFVSRSRR